MKRKLLIGLFLIVISFTLGVCGKEEIDKESNNQETELKENKKSNSSLGVGKYKVEKGNNSVVVITNDGSGISTTTYYFTNGKLTSATLIEEFTSVSIAKTSYETMKNESAIMNQYSDIKLVGKKIILNIKSEILSAYSSFNYEDFYNLMHDTYQAYME